MLQRRIHQLLFIIHVAAVLIHLALSDCIFPEKKLPNGRIRYQAPGDVNLTRANEGYLLRFRCNRGHTRVGPKAILCADNEWTEQVPQCLKMECPEPPSISNGYYTMKTGIDDRIVIGSTATYSCEVGYELENDTAAVLTCELDLKTNSVHWSNLTLRCIEKESCPDPGVSPDGEREGDCCFIRDVVKYSCNEGFELVGTDTLVCFPGGKWNALRPLCRPLDDHCDLPPFITHGAVIGEKEGDFYLPYDEVEIECEPGFKYQGPSEFNMCQDDIGWEYDFAGCEEFYCDPPEPLGNGSIPELDSTNATAFPYNFDITYVCNKGYRLIGDSWRFCDKNGWSKETPYCEEIRCPDPGVPEYGYRHGSNFEIGSKVTFSCFTGYTLIGSFERYCMPNGQWNGELSRCDTEDNYCPDPGIPVNGMKNSSRYDMGSKIGFQCKAGYTLMGSDVIECLPNRTWSGTEIKCVGPYEYDNTAQVGEILKLKVKENAEEQRRKLREYRLAARIIWENGTVIDPNGNIADGPKERIVDLNYPGRLILYFVFDVSGSIKEHNFRKSIEFAKAIVKKVRISENGARAGALTFSSEAETEFLPANYKTTEDVLHALDEIKYTGGGTATSTALTALRENLIPSTQAVLGVKGQKSIIFILTDGRVNMKGDPKEEATMLKNAGVEIYTIGIASNILRESLVQIASDPKKEHVFILQNYAVFDWLIQEITNGTIDYSRCGLGLDHLRIINGQAKIAGGRQATEPWPWMAALYITPRSGDPEEADLNCGGSVIHKHYVLTAAHCLYYKNVEERKKESQVTVYLGITDVNNKTSAQVIDVKKFYIHQKYRNDKSFDYDIALLKLKRPMEYNAFVRPICLPSANLPPDSPLYKPNELALAAGWGQEGAPANGEKPTFKAREHLKEVILTLQSRENCLEFLNKKKKGSLTDRMLCAGGDGNDTCQGDSGGPLMQSQQDADGNVYWTQVGITSWGFRCGVVNTYGFYTHVQNLVSWITETITNTINE